MKNELLPREKLLQFGESELSEEELLAILLRTGTSDCPVLELAHQLLRRFGNSLLELCDASVQELCQLPGIGMAKALELSASFALARRLARQKTGVRPKMESPLQIASYMSERYWDSRQEEFHVLLLDCHLRLQRSVRITQGLLDKSLVHAREVFRPAIREACSSIILCHNHPSGNPAPSEMDRQITERLCAAGDILGIRVLDHIIVSSQEKDTNFPAYFSFAENQAMPKSTLKPPISTKQKEP